MLKQLAAFPGPLGAATPKDKLLKWLADQAAAAAAAAAGELQARQEQQQAGGVGGEPPPGAAAQRLLLWEALRLLVKHADAAAAAGKAGGKQAAKVRWAGNPVCVGGGVSYAQAVLESFPALWRGCPFLHSFQSQIKLELVKFVLLSQGGKEEPSMESELARLLLHPSSLSTGGAAAGSNGAAKAAASRASGDGAAGAAEADVSALVSGAFAVGGPPVLAAPPPEAAQQAAAQRMQRLLVLGRKAEALRVASDAGLWGPALLLATAVGGGDGRAFQEAATAMARALLLPGTPARTLALVLAGRPDLVHAADGVAAAAAGGPDGAAAPPSASAARPFGVPAPPGAGAHAPPAGFFNPPMPSAAAPPPPAGGAAASAGGSCTLLGSWHEHLAVLLGTRGPADASEAVLRLGDRLRGDPVQVGGVGGVGGVGVAGAVGLQGLVQRSVAWGG